MLALALKIQFKVSTSISPWSSTSIHSLNVCDGDSFFFWADYREHPFSFFFFLFTDFQLHILLQLDESYLMHGYNYS